METKIKPSEIPQEIVALMREHFEADPKVCHMRAQANMAQRNRQYMNALMINKKLETLFVEVVSQYCQEAERDVQKLNLMEAGLSEEQAKDSVRKITTMFMAIDIIDSCIMDVDDILRSVDKDLTFDTFDDVRKLAEMCKQKLSFFAKQADYIKSPLWGTMVDNIYEMMQNKAKSLMSKIDK